MHSGLQYEESLSSSEKKVDERFENEYKSLMNHHVEPSWRTPVNKKNNKNKEKSETQGETL